MSDNVQLQDVTMSKGLAYHIDYFNEGSHKNFTGIFTAWDVMKDQFEFVDDDVSIIIDGTDVLKVTPVTADLGNPREVCVDIDPRLTGATAEIVITDDVMSHNVGNSDYAKHNIQPWDIWEEYKLNPWDADIIKRVLRDKPQDGRLLDYQKIIHICQKRIEMLTR